MKNNSKIKTIFRLLASVGPLVRRMVFAVVMGTLGFLAAQFIPIVGALAIFSIATGSSRSLATLWIILPCLAVLRAVFRLGEQWTNHYIAFTLLAVIRDKLFRALRKLCPAKLDVRDKGDLISVITSDVELLEVFFAHTISPVCIAVLSSTVMCIFIGSFDLRLGLLALLAFLTVGLILPVLIAKRNGTTGTELRAQAGDLSAYMLENIRGLDETIQYNCGAQRLAEMTAKTEDFSKKRGRLSSLASTNSALSNSVILLFDIGMLIMSGRLYMNGQVDLAGFIIPLVALMSSFGPVSALANLGTTLAPTLAAAARVLAIQDEIPATEEITGQPKVDFEGAAVKSVTFGYGTEDILKDCSLTFRPNRIIGIVGKSGSGKSTLLKLLMRFHQVEKGEILISNRNINRINTSNLREIESYMTQETQLFKDTVANNIRIGDLTATDEEVIAAARQAALHDFVMSLPQGYETQVGEAGSNLSSGERQRIGLARAFLHKAPFMLLDEPTSNLDSLNEAIILRSIQNETVGRTVLLVSHRQSTVNIATEVFCMDNGRIS